MLANVATRLRSVVKRNPYRQEVIEYMPQQEGPARMMKMAINLLKSLAVIRERSTVNETDLSVIRKVCLDSIPSMRRNTLRNILTKRKKVNFSGEFKIKDLLAGSKLTYETIRLQTENLTCLGVCHKAFKKNALDDSIHENAVAHYTLDNESYELLGKSEILEEI